MSSQLKEKEKQPQKDNKRDLEADDVFNQQLFRTLAYAGAGFGAGLVASVFLKHRKALTLMGTGAGAYMGATGFMNELNSFNRFKEMAQGQTPQTLKREDQLAVKNWENYMPKEERFGPQKRFGGSDDDNDERGGKSRQESKPHERKEHHETDVNQQRPRAEKDEGERKYLDKKEQHLQTKVSQGQEKLNQVREKVNQGKEQLKESFNKATQGKEKENLKEDLQRKVSQGKEQLKESWNKASQGKEQAKEELKNKANQAKEQFKDASKYVSDNKEQIKEDIKSKANQAKDQVKDYVNKASQNKEQTKEDLKNKANQAKDQVKDYVNKATQGKEQTKEDLKNKANQAKEQVKDTVKNVSQNKEQIKEDIKNKANQGKEQVKESLNKASQGKEQAKDELKNKANQAKEQVKDTVNKATQGKEEQQRGQERSRSGERPKGEGQHLLYSDLQSYKEAGKPAPGESKFYRGAERDRHRENEREDIKDSQLRTVKQDKVHESVRTGNKMKVEPPPENIAGGQFSAQGLTAHSQVNAVIE